MGSSFDRIKGSAQAQAQYWLHYRRAQAQAQVKLLLTTKNVCIEEDKPITPPQAW